MGECRRGADTGQNGVWGALPPPHQEGRPKSKVRQAVGEVSHREAEARVGGRRGEEHGGERVEELHGCVVWVAVVAGKGLGTGTGVARRAL